MTFANPIVEAGVSGLHELYSERAVTPLEATEAYLSRISGLDGALGAYVALDAAGARAAADASAERWASGAPLSPIDGAPLAVKCNIAVKGLPWHAGIGAYRDRIAEADAACIARLREAGAVILGLVNMHEGALGAVTDNPWFGRSHNPWRPGYTAGGSSGGSGTATAAGLCAAALGTDTLGSVRIPAAYCGVFGHKPTQGLISTAGVIPLSWTLDHVGVLARSALDCALVMAAACSADRDLAEELARPADPASLTSSPVAVLQWGDKVEVDPVAADRFQATIERARAAGLELEPVTLSYEYGDMLRLGLLISEAEASAEHKAALAAGGKGFSDGFRALLEWGANQPAVKLASAYRELADVADAVKLQLSPYAAILMPTAPQHAFPFEAKMPLNQAHFTALGDILGLPATAFPAGEGSDGLPASAQALAWDDETSLGLARLLADPVGAPPAYRG